MICILIVLAAMASALIASAADKDPNVQETVLVALTKLGKHQHAIALGALRHYILNTPKVLLFILENISNCIFYRPT